MDLWLDLKLVIHWIGIKINWNTFLCNIWHISDDYVIDMSRNVYVNISIVNIDSVSIIFELQFLNIATIPKHRIIKKFLYNITIFDMERPTIWINNNGALIRTTSSKESELSHLSWRKSIYSYHFVDTELHCTWLT